MSRLRTIVLYVGVVLVALLPGCTSKDTTPPQVISISPAFGEQGVALDTSISISFTKTMDKNSVMSNFRLEPGAEGVFSWSENTFVFTPETLTPGTEYVGYFVEPPKDIRGNSLGEFSLRFATDTREAAVYTIRSFQWMPDGQSLMYSSDRDGVWGIWEVNVSTREQRRLVDNHGHHLDPTSSRNGKYVAYVSAVLPELYIYNTSTRSESKHVLDSHGILPARPRFSPDGRYLSYLLVFGGADAHSDVYQSLHIMDLTQSPVTATKVSPTDETDLVLGYSSDSTRLYLLSTFDGYNYGRHFRYDLWAIDLSTQEKLRLTTDGPFANFLAGSLHPSGEHFVYGSWEARDVDLSIILSPTSLYVVNLNPFSIAPLTMTGRNAYPSFSPDGTKIVYAMDNTADSSSWDLYVAHFDPSGSVDAPAQQLTSNSHSKLFPQWSPDGSMVAFIQVEGEDHSIWVMNSSGGGLQRLTR